MQPEIWRPIAGFPAYDVSNLGRVRRRGRLLSGTLRKDGYRAVSLSCGGRAVKRLVHRLVAAEFLRPPWSLEQVNHKNANKGDNAVGNLEWCTLEENRAHAAAAGLNRRTGA